MNQREFEIKLGILVMECLAHGLRQKDLIAAIEIKLREEKRLEESRRLDAASY